MNSTGKRDEGNLKVLHIITGLGDGGAEGVLYRLIKHGSSSVEHGVVSLTGEGKYGPLLRRREVPVEVLEVGTRGLRFRALKRLHRIIRRFDPDVVQTWMYHGDLLGGLAARANSRPVVWGIRSGGANLKIHRMATRVVIRACAVLSPVVPKVISCASERSATEHRSLGYADRFTVVPNGYDLERFAPDPSARRRVREEWAIEGDTPLIGFVGRLHPHKAHTNLLEALSILRRSAPQVRCVLVGTDCDPTNGWLNAIIRARGLENTVILAGSRSDVPAVMNALDLHVLPSLSEGFPNTVAEAMACGVPNVVTDVGDAALIVDDTGWVVPPAEPAALAGAIMEAMRARTDSIAWSARCHDARARIERGFGLKGMVNTYEKIWSSVADQQN